MQKLYKRDDLSIWSGSLRQSESRSLGWKQDLHLLCQELRLWKRMQRERLQPNRSRYSKLQEDHQVQCGLLQDWPMRSSTGQWRGNLNGRRIYAVCMRNCSFYAFGFKMICSLLRCDFSNQDTWKTFIQSQRFFLNQKILKFVFANGPINSKFN